MSDVLDRCKDWLGAAWCHLSGHTLEYLAAGFIAFCVAIVVVAIVVMLRDMD